jgi:hypothetical protein
VIFYAASNAANGNFAPTEDFIRTTTATAQPFVEEPPPPPPPPPPIAEDQEFEITLTNLTQGAPGEGGQVFSPPIFISHTSAVKFLGMGQPASEELRFLAEDGNNVPLAQLAAASDEVGYIASENDVIPPGGSLTVRLEGGLEGWLLSFAAMLVETNDGIVAVNSVPLFDENGAPRSFTLEIVSYDAGTEENNELATHVPGPPFGGNERDPSEGGVITPHPGISGNADVGLQFNWTEPTALLTVEPVEEEEPPPPPPPPPPVIIGYGYATLSGANEVPAIEGPAAGTAALGLDDEGNLHFSLTVAGLSGPIAAAHFHGPAPEGENAGVIFEITGAFDGNHAEGVWEGLTAEQLEDLFDGLLYLNVHTEANPGGEIRGQVHMNGNGVAHLSGENEVPPVEVDGAGTGVFKLMDEGALWYNITVTNLTGPIAAAHFHGPATEAESAGVIFAITETFDGLHAEGVWEGVTEEQFGYLLDGLVYVNVHTEANPGGEIRGQVVGLELPEEPPVEEPEEPEFVAFGYAALSGANEVPAIEGPATGTAAVGLDDEGNLHFSLTVTGLSGPIAAAHFHGPAPEGENAGVIFEITGAFDGNYAEGVWEGLTEEQLGYLYDGLLYLNVHTEAHPGGEIRGQVHMGPNGVALLNGESEVPPVEVDGVGTGVFKLVNGGTALWYNITATNLTGPIAAAHFHGPATEEESTGVIFAITETFDGLHAEGVWDGLTAVQLGYLLDGLVYVNIHTEANPGGEIRGQVLGLVFPGAPSDEVFAFDLQLDVGLNMVSLPLMPDEPFTAQTFVEALGATIVVRFDTARQRFIGYTAGQDGDAFPIEGGQGYIVNVLDAGVVTFIGKAWRNQPAAAPANTSVTASAKTWAFVVSGDVLDAEPGRAYTIVAKNLRTGTVATDQASMDDLQFASVWADLSRRSVIEAGDTLEIKMLDEDGNIVSGPFQRHITVDDIRNAYFSLPLRVGDVRPTETLLAQNFPNPFNPETWIPYQLVKPSYVTIRIYDTTGRLVRTLDLGLKSTGFYTTRSTAAYWDGRNHVGEKVASGVYFYTFETDEYTSTRKMLIAK